MKEQFPLVVKEQWILGGIDEETREMFIVPVEDRSAATMLPIIQQFVLPGNTIKTDCWAAYNGLTALG